MNVFVRLLVCMVGFVLAALPAEAQVSRCLAMAGNGATVIKAALADDEVLVRYINHSTFLMETPKGVTIATDYAGYAGQDTVPMVVTMNRAHETHYTSFPDPGIEHVLRGWNPDGGAANHNLEIRDVRIRNVPTNIRSWSGGTEMDGNSIFIFEVAGLCIGHLGHLHHTLGAEHLGWIGRLDVVMVPVDGSFTLAHDEMTEVLKTLRAQVVLPMHYFGGSSLQRFVSALSGAFAIDMAESSQIVLSERRLPKQPTMIILPPSN